MTCAEFKELSNLTDEEIASRLGVHRPSWSRWKNGHCHPAGILLELALDMLYVELQNQKLTAMQVKSDGEVYG